MMLFRTSVVLGTPTTRCRLIARAKKIGIAPPSAVLTFPRRRLAAVLRHEAFHAGPGLDQSALDREVLTREELADFPVGSTR
jgi:hypothetical protein